jgi:glutamate-1-semialdehyde 2,1-aminomutase
MPYCNFGMRDEDRELARKLGGFIPSNVFDAHMHIHDACFSPTVPSMSAVSGDRKTMKEYLEHIGPCFPGVSAIRANMIPMPDKTFGDRGTGNRLAAARFMAGQLDQYPGNTGEVYVLPDDTAEEIERLLIHPRIRGLKCYAYTNRHYSAPDEQNLYSAVHDFLPESAWEAANAHGLAITLHVVRNGALSDPDNFADITAMAKKYPKAKLILAHCGRAFAGWTCMEPLKRLGGYANIFFDMSAICEPMPIFYCIKYAGAGRVLWGSDYPIAMYPQSRSLYPTDIIGYCLRSWIIYRLTAPCAPTLWLSRALKRFMRPAICWNPVVPISIIFFGETRFRYLISCRQ